MVLRCVRQYGLGPNIGLYRIIRHSHGVCVFVFRRIVRYGVVLLQHGVCVAKPRIQAVFDILDVRRSIRFIRGLGRAFRSVLQTDVLRLLRRVLYRGMVRIHTRRHDARTDACYRPQNARRHSHCACGNSDTVLVRGRVFCTIERMARKQIRQSDLLRATSDREYILCCLLHRNFVVCVQDYSRA